MSDSVHLLLFAKCVPKGISHYMALRTDWPHAGRWGVGVVSTHCWLISGAIGSSNKWLGGLDERRAHAVGHQ